MEPCVKRTSHCLNHPKMSRWILSVLSATNTGRSHMQNALQSPWAYPCRALAGNGEGKQQDHAVTSASLNTMLTTACWVAELWGWVTLSALRNSSAVTRKGFYFLFFLCALQRLSFLCAVVCMEGSTLMSEGKSILYERKLAQRLTWTLSCQM